MQAGRVLMIIKQTKDKIGIDSLILRFWNKKIKVLIPQVLQLKLQELIGSLPTILKIISLFCLLAMCLKTFWTKIHFCLLI